MTSLMSCTTAVVTEMSSYLKMWWGFGDFRTDIAEITPNGQLWPAAEHIFTTWWETSWFWLYIHWYIQNKILVMIPKQKAQKGVVRNTQAASTWTASKGSTAAQGSFKESLRTIDQVQPICQPAAERRLCSTKVRERGTFGVSWGLQELVVLFPWNTNAILQGE